MKRCVVIAAVLVCFTSFRPSDASPRTEAIQICQDSDAESGPDIYVRSDTYTSTNDYGVARNSTCSCDIHTQDTATDIWTIETELDCAGSNQTLRLIDAHGVEIMSWDCNVMVKKNTNLHDISGGATLVWVGQINRTIGRFWIDFQGVNTTVRCGQKAVSVSTTSPVTHTAASTSPSKSTTPSTPSSTTAALSRSNTPPSAGTSSSTTRPSSPLAKITSPQTEEPPKTRAIVYIAGVCGGLLFLVVLISTVLALWKRYATRQARVGVDQDSPENY